MKLIHTLCGSPVIKFVKYSRLLNGTLDLANPMFSHFQCVGCDMAVSKEDTITKKKWRINYGEDDSDGRGDCVQECLVF